MFTIYHPSKLGDSCLLGLNYLDTVMIFTVKQIVTPMTPIVKISHDLYNRVKKIPVADS